MPDSDHNKSALIQNIKSKPAQKIAIKSTILYILYAHYYSKVLVLLFLKEVSSAQQSCIYLIKNTVKMWNIITVKTSCFLREYLLKCNLFLWSKLYFQHHYSSLQCHMIFRNHSNMLICCSRNISDYYQCWKQLCCSIFLWRLWCILFFRIHRWIESSKEQHLFEI